MTDKTLRNRFRIGQSGFLLMITIILFILTYAAGMVIFADKGFARLQTFLNLFINNAGLIVMACGLTVVMITAGIDISVGSLTALTCMMLAYGMEIKGYGAVSMCIFAMFIGLVFGLVQGFLVAYLKIQPFIVTLAGMFFARGMTAIISKNMISIRNPTFLSWAQSKIYLPFGGYVNNKGAYIAPYIYPTVVIAICMLIIVALMLKFTGFGRSLYAVGGNEHSAMLMGLNVRRSKLFAYVLSSFLCSIGGVLYCLNSCAGFVEQAKGLEMNAIASSVIGGTLLTGGVGSPVGSLFGVLISGTIEAFITTQGKLSSWWTRIAIAALLCFFIMLQSLLSRAKRKRT